MTVQWIGVCAACDEIPWENWQERQRHRILAEINFDCAGWPTNIRFIEAGADDCAICADVCQEMRDDFINTRQDIADWHATCEVLSREMVAFEQETQEIHRLAGV